jgi:nucleoside-diphosphate-sugar epimerase
MSVLVTGAGGFMGGALVRRLLARGEIEVRCVVRRPRQRDRLEQSPAVRCHVGDLRDRGLLEAALDGVGTVYHLAATMKGSFSDMVMGTVVASKHLIEVHAATGCGARIVLVSSFAVYGTASLEAGALVDETTPLEPRPVERGGYAYAKLRQEQLLSDYARATGTELVILRPGVVYGPGGGAFSPRVGVQLPGLFLHLGGRNVIPFTYVDNCAEAVAVAAAAAPGGGEAYNVVDDDLLTSSQYLRAYRRRVRRLRYLSIPYPVMRVLASAVEAYHRRSHGQLPAFFTRYKTDSNWKGCVFSNSRIKALGWEPIVDTQEGMRRTFDYLREQAGV